MAGKDVQRYGSMLIGIEVVTKEIKFYTLFEAIYLTKPLQSANQLADTLVESYENLLRFLAKACRYYSTGTLGMSHPVTRFRSIVNARSSPGN
jgi:hypothetical protein